MFVDREALKIYVPARTELRLNGPGDIDGRLEAEVGHAVLDDLEVDGDDAGHLDGAAERDLAVTLCKLWSARARHQEPLGEAMRTGEVQVAAAELCARDVDGQVDLAAPAQVLDAACPERVSQPSTARLVPKTRSNVSSMGGGGGLKRFLTRSCPHAPAGRGSFVRPPSRPSPWSRRRRSQRVRSVAEAVARRSGRACWRR